MGEEMRIPIAPWIVGVVGCVMVVLLALSIWSFSRVDWTARAIDSEAADRAERIEDKQKEDERTHKENIEELEIELERVREYRQKLQELIKNITELSMLIIGVVLFSTWAVTDCAHAQDIEAPSAIEAPAWTLGPGGRICFHPIDTGKLLAASMHVPRLELTITALQKDREAAAQEIRILEQLRAEEANALAKALRREGHWQELNALLRAENARLAALNQAAHKSRNIWLGVGLAAVGGAVAALSLQLAR